MFAYDRGLEFQLPFSLYARFKIPLDIRVVRSSGVVLVESLVVLLAKILIVHFSPLFDEGIYARVSKIRFNFEAFWPEL